MSQSLLHGLSQSITTLKPYVPGKPIEETQREFGLKRVIKLASNENPLGPSPKAVAWIRSALKDLHRYPDASGYHLKATIARYADVPENRVLLGNGSNDVIDLLIRTLCQPGDKIVTPAYSFIAYRICAQAHGVGTIDVPNHTDYTADVERLLSAVEADHRVRMVFLANPNNPTGSYLDGDQVARLAEGLGEIGKARGNPVFFALDAAYTEYIDPNLQVDERAFVIKYPHLILLRTFSKIYGLAGLRVGYGIGDAAVMSMIERVRQPFNVSSLGLGAAQAALGDRAFVKKTAAVNRAGLRFWLKNLKTMGIPALPSQGNFLMLDVRAGCGLSGVELYEQCLKNGVIFRPIANYGLPDHLRITIGSDTENKIAIRVLGQVLVQARARALGQGPSGGPGNGKRRRGTT